MSRIGKQPIVLPPKVEVSIGKEVITVKGPLGTLVQPQSKQVLVKQDGDTLVLSMLDDTKQANAMMGTMHALLANMVHGVNNGFEKKLSLIGVGYKAQAQGGNLNLTLGFSHPIIHSLPNGVRAETPIPTEIWIKGICKQKVGQVAADVRHYRPPEPYKGKGIRYSDEVIVLKETKKK